MEHEATDLVGEKIYSLQTGRYMGVATKIVREGIILDGGPARIACSLKDIGLFYGTETEAVIRFPRILRMSA